MILQMFIKLNLCAEQCSRCWRYRGEHGDQEDCSPGACILVTEDKELTNKYILEIISESDKFCKGSKTG